MINWTKVPQTIIDYVNSKVVQAGTLILGETASDAYRGDRGKTAYDHSQSTGNPHSTTIADITNLQTDLNAKLDITSFTDAEIKSKLGISTLSGSNTGDQDLSGYQITSGKDATGGYAGLTLFKINFKNAANTFTSFLTNVNTAARTYTFPDYSMTVAGKISDFLVIKSTADSGIKIDEVTPTYSWADLKGVHYIDASGTAAPTMETFEAGVERPGYNATDKCRTELHIEHRDVVGGVKYLHPHIQIASAATASGGTNLVLSHVIKHSYGSIGSGETRGASPSPITIVQTITVAEINAIGAGNNKAFDIEYANTGGTGGKLNSSNMLPDDLIEITTTVISIPTISGGTSNKVAITPIDGHREVKDGSGTKNKDRSGGSFYGTT